MKIITPLRPRSRTELLKLVEKVGDRADIIELWLDGLAWHGGMMEEVRDISPRAQFLGVCKTPEEQGTFTGTETARVKRLQDFLDSGGDFVDLDIRTTSLQGVRSFPAEKLWLSYHDFKSMPNDLPELKNAMKFFRPYLMKFAVTPRSQQDLDDFLTFTRSFYWGERGIFTTMGSYGREGREELSRHNITWGSFYALDINHTTASGQSTLDDIRGNR